MGMASDCMKPIPYSMPVGIKPGPLFMGRNDRSILAFYCVWRWGFQGPHLLTNGDGAMEITIAVRNILDLYEIHDVILDLNKRDMM